MAECASPRCIPQYDLSELKLELAHTSRRLASDHTFYIWDAAHFFVPRLRARNLKAVDSLYRQLEQLYACTTVQNLYSTYTSIMREYRIEHIATRDHDVLLHQWTVRECCTCILLYSAYRCSMLAQSIAITPYPARTLYREDCTITIVGSNYLNSDIDATISAEHGSSWAAVLEDLALSTGWFNLHTWDIQLYADFMLVGEYYIDTHYFSRSIKAQLLELAVRSYYLHAHSDTFNDTLLRKCIAHIVRMERLNIDMDALCSTARTPVDRSDREQYYTLLRTAEATEARAVATIEGDTPTAAAISNQFGAVMIQLGTANLYRFDNYILTSTTTQIVKVEQSHALESDKCSPLLTRVAKCSLSNFAYLCSAVEQLGYMQAYLTTSACNIKAGKYFGRFVRSIAQVPSVISSVDAYSVCIAVSGKLDTARRTCSTCTACNTPWDLYTLCNNLVQNINTVKKCCT